MPRKAVRCSFWGDNRQCARPGQGNPPLCVEHTEMLEVDDVDVIVDAAFQRMSEIPQVRSVLSSLGGVIDQFAGLLDRVPIPPPPRGRGENSAKMREARERAAAWKARAQEAQKYARKAQEHARRAQQQAARPQPPKKEDPRVILGLPPGVALTKEQVKKRHRELAAVYHPDKGGNTEMMQRLTAARDELLKALGG